MTFNELVGASTKPRFRTAVIALSKLDRQSDELTPDSTDQACGLMHRECSEPR